MSDRLPSLAPLAALALWLAAASAAAAGLSVEVRTEDAELLLQPGKTVAVDIRARDENGQGVGGLDLVLAASAGALEGLSDQGGGRYRAVYRMPSFRHPQPVILAAKAPGAPPGFAVLRLRAKTTLPVNTSKPHVMVTLQIGKRSYGPHKTDARGEVSVPVEVRPGETEARAVAVDEFGNRTHRRVEIPVPPTRLLLGMAERTRLVADGEDHTDVYLVVLEPDGTPDANAAFVAYKKRGEVSSARRLGPGLYRLRYTAPARRTRPQARLVVASQRAPRVDRQAFRFELGVGPPARLELRATDDELVANGRSTTELELAVTDRGGNPLSVTALRLRCEPGTVSAPRETAEGRFRATYTAPVGAERAATCTATLPGEKPKATARIALFDPVPARLKLEADTRRLAIDGRSRATFSVRLEDRQGMPIRSARVRAHAAIGTVGEVAATGEGGFRFDYTAPRSTTSSWVRVFVEARSGSNVLSDDLVLQLEPPPAPAPGLPWVTLGPWAGVTTNFARMTYAAFSLESDLRLPFGDGCFYLRLEGGYRFGQDESPASDRSIRLDTRLEYIPLHLSLLFKPWPRAVITPYAGIGGGAELVQWTLTASDGARERGHRLLPGVVARVGGEVRLGPGAFFVDLRYLYAWLSARASTGGSLVKGNIGGLEIGGGYRLFFP